MKLKIKKLDPRAVIPEYKTEGAAGCDISVLLDSDREILERGKIKMFRTGFAAELKNGYEIQIRSRSGLSLKNGVIVLNAPGTVDSDYRGEICLIVANLGAEDFVVENGMRLGQMVVARYEKADIEEVEELSETKRGGGAFGSTGMTK
ncbi:MAG: dUTP diphosphatase [Rickettsiales bacterium]|jgi:dUTP pyrophosphatase|nr:dUTP diphosphatase [Rickettsiales bacterium]